MGSYSGPSYCYQHWVDYSNFHWMICCPNHEMLNCTGCWMMTLLNRCTRSRLFSASASFCSCLLENGCSRWLLFELRIDSSRWTLIFSRYCLLGFRQTWSTDRISSLLVLPLSYLDRFCIAKVTGSISWSSRPCSHPQDSEKSRL